MRIAVFVDYWNFQLAMNRAVKNDRSKIDWKNVGQFCDSYEPEIPVYSQDDLKSDEW